MPFNSDTYHRNKWKRTALAELAQAREIKARVAAGTAYEWELPRIARCAEMARGSWRLYLSCKRICEIKKTGRKL